MRRTAGNHGRPSGPGIVTGSLFHGVITSLEWDFGGMGFPRPRLGPQTGPSGLDAERRDQARPGPPSGLVCDAPARLAWERRIRRHRRWMVPIRTRERSPV